LETEVWDRLRDTAITIIDMVLVKKRVAIPTPTVYAIPTFEV